MNFKHFFKVMILICFLVSIMGVSASDYNGTDELSVDDSTLYEVNGDFIDEELADDSNGPESELEDDADAFNELVNRIENAYSSEVIRLDRDYDLSNVSRGIEINQDNITIDGNGYVFHGGENLINYTLITVTGSNVVLEDIVFVSIKSDDYNNLMEWFGENGTIASCSFYDNLAYDGGIIDWTGSLGTIENCEFLGNVAYDDASIIHASSNGFKVHHTYFENNSAENYSGAIKIDGKGYNITSCLFINNTAYEAGAVYAFGSEGIVDMCNFTENHAEKGGAIGWMSNEGKIMNSVFKSNSAAEGGAIYLSSSDTVIFNCTFIDNTALEGGAINTFDNKNSTINASRFYSNQAMIGGAVCIENDNYILNSEFVNNNATVGGAIFSNGESNITNSIFTNNTADLLGGAIAFEGDGEIASSEFTNNTADIAGAIITEGNLTIKDTTFKGNVGKLYSTNNVVSEVSDVTLDNVTSDTPVSLKLAEMDLITIENTKYGEELSISFNVTFDDQLLVNPDATVLLKIDDKTYSANASMGSAVFNISGLNAGNHKYTAIYECPGFVEYELNGNFTVDPLQATLTAKSASFVINYGGKYSVTLKDEYGNAVSSQKITFILNGKTIGSAKTNAKGVATIKLSAKNLKTAKAGSKKLVIKVNGVNYKVSAKTVTIKINKEKPKIVAKKKTFKKSVKTKKYSITLKNSKGKAIKKVKVTLKVKGKTFKAKTNSKGKATFKIKKLTKKGTFKAKVTYKGNAYYKKVTKKVKIKIK